MNRDQDAVIARALADMPVPEHGAGFWEELDRRLDRAALAEAAGLTPANAPSPIVALDEVALDLRDAPSSPEPPDDVRTSTGELPTVADLGPPGPTPRRPKIWFAAAAVVLVVLAVGLAGSLAGDDDPDTTTPASDDTAAADDDPATTAVSTTAAPTTAIRPPPSVPPEPAPLAATAVARWLDSVAAGDVDTAAGLTGPRSVAYMASQSDTALDEALRTSAEGYGAMAGAADLSMQELSLGRFEFGEVVLVTVSGTFTGEGYEAGYTTFVFPVVIDGGEALVEPWAFSPETGGRFEVTQPSSSPEGNVLLPDQAIELFVPVDGTVFFHLGDGDEGIRPVDTSTVAGSPFARYDPPGELAQGDHTVVLGFVSPDGDILLGEALALTVP